MELRNTPWVNKFRRAAIAHEEGARYLLSHCSPKSASTLCGEVVYLSGYVGECGLKAVLMNWTPDSRHSKLIESFKKPNGAGRDLEKLRSALLGKGCPIPVQLTREVRLLASRWFSGMRYEGRRFHHGDATRLYGAGKFILDWVLEV